MRKAILSAVVITALLGCDRVTADETPAPKPCPPLSGDEMIALVQAAEELDDWIVMRTNRSTYGKEPEDKDLIESVQKDMESLISKFMSHAPLGCEKPGDCPDLYSCPQSKDCTAVNPLPAPATAVFRGYAVTMAHAWAAKKTADWKDCEIRDMSSKIDQHLTSLRNTARANDCTTHAQCAPCKCKDGSCSCSPDP